MVVPPPPADLPELSIEEIVRLKGDAARGKTAAARCVMCHSIDGAGAELGPALDGWGRGKSAEVIARALVNPSAEIAQGYEGMEIRTKDGLTIQGVLIKEGDPLMMRSMGGITQIIPPTVVANAPADDELADDERRAAWAHRAGRRGPHRVSQREVGRAELGPAASLPAAVSLLRKQARPVDDHGEGNVRIPCFRWVRHQKPLTVRTDYESNSKVAAE